LPWVLTPGISSTQAAYQSSTCLYAAVSFMLISSSDSALYAESVAVQEQVNADSLVSFTPGNYYFTIRALRPEAKDHLTVIYNRKAYVPRLSASEKPFYTVTFFQEGCRLCRGRQTRLLQEPGHEPGGLFHCG
jgi:hypothetical protein